MPRTRPKASPTHDAAFIAASIERWFKASARDLPWREPSPIKHQRRNPYHALVAESMLQQTQVSRVMDKFAAFIERFPTVAALASADESEVLGAWTGLGYYRRARNLHAAAKTIIDTFDGVVPRTAAQLIELKGVGRYTAGAIASIAFDEPAPIVDGNVARVLLRVHGREVASDDKASQPWLWEQATALVHAAKSPGVFNEGLMELGATICTPAPSTPACGRCPLQGVCIAHRDGREMEIPRPKKAAKRTTIYCTTVHITRDDGHLLIEQRDDTGMWAGLWQAPTIERTDRHARKTEIAKAVGLRARAMQKVDTFEFLATHRRLMFQVYKAKAPEGHITKSGSFRSRSAISSLGLSTPQRRILLAQ